MAVQHSPEKFAAYVGTGQMVDPFATDKLMYAESIRDAQARGDRSAVKTLRALGPPPYDDPLDYPIAISSNPKWIHFTHGADYNTTSEYPASRFVREYSLVEQLRGMAAIAETFHVLYPQLSDTDFRVDIPSLEIPVNLVEGRHEASGRVTLARTWFDRLAAPHKRWVSFQNSGHTALRRARSLRPADARRAHLHQHASNVTYAPLPWGPLALRAWTPGPEARTMAPGTRQSFPLTNVVANPILIPLLKSWVGRRLGRRLGVIEYVGRRSGDQHQLVAQYVRNGTTVRIRVGTADHKTWWRNFLTAHPVRLHLAGHCFDATAHVVREGDGMTVVAVLDDRAP